MVFGASASILSDSVWLEHIVCCIALSGDTRCHEVMLSKSSSRGSEFPMRFHCLPGIARRSALITSSRNNCNLSSLPNHALNPCPSGQIMGQICPSHISSVSFGFIQQNFGFVSRPAAANHDFRRVRRSKSSKIACPPPGQITVIARTCNA